MRALFSTRAYALELAGRFQGIDSCGAPSLTVLLRVECSYYLHPIPSLHCKENVPPRVWKKGAGNLAHFERSQDCSSLFKEMTGRISVLTVEDRA